MNLPALHFWLSGRCHLYLRSNPPWSAVPYLSAWILQRRLATKAQTSQCVSGPEHSFLSIEAREAGRVVSYAHSGFVPFLNVFH